MANFETLKTAKKLPKCLEMAMYMAKLRGGDTAHFVTELGSNSSPKILGGHLTAMKEENGFLGHHYAKVHRPSPKELPGIHSIDADFMNQDVEKAYKKLYGAGEVSFVMYATRRNLHQDLDKDIIDFAIMTFLDSTDVDENFQGPVVDLRIMVNGHQEGIVNEAFQRSLTLGQKNALFRRTTHLFLRCMGCSLPRPLFRKICENLQDEHTNNGWWKEALDLGMIYADVVLSDDLDLEWKVSALEQVAQLLETCKDFETASLVYQDIATSFWDRSIDEPGRSRLAMWYSSASTDCVRALNYVDAEELFLKSTNIEFVRTAGSNKFPWSNADERQRTSLRDLMLIYKAWLKVDLATYDARFHATLVALLAVGKVSSPEPGVDYFEREFALFGVPSGAASVLMPQYRSKKVAQRVLTHAIMADPFNMANFRSTIISACNDRFLIYGTGLMHRNALNPEDKKQYQKEQKEAARKKNLEEFPKQGTGAVFSVQCALPTCGLLRSLDNLQFCPCKMVGYCGKECQVADWKRHKKDCVWQAQKKKAGKK